MKPHIILLLFILSCKTSTSQKESNSRSDVDSQETLFVRIQADTLFKTKGFLIELERTSKQNISLLTIMKEGQLVLSDSLESTAHLLNFQDYNQDGELDLLVQCSSDVSSNWTYHLYLVNSQASQFTKIPDFKHIKNPEIRNEIITSHISSGSSYYQFYSLDSLDIIQHDLIIYDSIWNSSKAVVNQKLDSVTSVLRQNRCKNIRSLAQEEILDLEFYLTDEIEDWYSENYKQNTNSKVWVLADIFSLPCTSSEKVGELITFYDQTESNFVIQFRKNNDKITKEIRRIGDWGYGIHINAISATHDFVRLPDDFLSHECWIKLGDYTEGFNGGVNSYIDQIVYLTSSTVTNLSTRSNQKLEQGNYVVEKIQGQNFIIRKEVPTDMPCGEEVEVIDINTLDRFKLPWKNLYGEQGDMNIQYAYPRGC
jgi:hypothetical protein